MNASFLPRDTTDALASLPIKERGRSLYFDRYARPGLSGQDRHNYFTDGFGAHFHTAKASSWSGIIESICKEKIYAQLKSRLIVNMAGGVMENAGLCLDRFGMPYIPGSAIKGCARRAALAALREWCVTGVKPGAMEDDKGNLFRSACERFADPASMLASIARVFGWSEQDWKDNQDFGWACGGQQSPILTFAAELLAQSLRLCIPQQYQDKPWKALPNFAGNVSFLFSYPVDVGTTGKVDGLTEKVPNLGKLELDVVTVHHKNYYGSNDPNAVATDTEEPVPNVFPAVAAGHVFAFPLAMLRNCPDADLSAARTWLTCGLSTFGIGGKTNAGYGWFDPDVDQKVRELLEAAEQRRKDEIKRRQEEARQKMEEEKRRRNAEERKLATANMTPEQLADYDVAQLSDDQFRNWLYEFHKRERSQQEAMVRAMRLSPDEPASRRSFWIALKSKAQKGGKPAKIELAIRELSKKMFPGKEGKMP